MGHVNWKDGSSQTHYQKVAKMTKYMVCDICGKTCKDRLDTHHVDRDHTNNSPDNIHIWCVGCHAKYHYIVDDRGLQGWNPNTPKLLEFRKRLDELKIEYTVPIQKLTNTTLALFT